MCACVAGMCVEHVRVCVQACKAVWDAVSGSKIRDRRGFARQTGCVKMCLHGCVCAYIHIVCLCMCVCV